jgi:anti-sigma B factor antagonist
MLDRRDTRPHRKARRKEMQEFSIDLIPLDCKDTVVFRPRGSVDSVSAPILENRLDDAIKNRQYRIVIDLSKTDFVSSAGLGLILGTVSRLRQNGGDLILMKIPQDLQDTFQLMSVDDYFETIDSLDELGISKTST